MATFIEDDGTRRWDIPTPEELETTEEDGMEENMTDQELAYWRAVSSDLAKALSGTSAEEEEDTYIETGDSYYMVWRQGRGYLVGWYKDGAPIWGHPTDEAFMYSTRAEAERVAERTFGRGQVVEYTMA